MACLGKSKEKDMYFGAKPELFRLAEVMRRNQTPAESILWKHLKKYRQKGLVFRRQHPLELFIADFYCHKIRLVIEVDGEIHSSDHARNHDNGRTGEIERLGVKVIRFTNEQVFENIESVIDEINLFTGLHLPPLSPGAGDKRG